MHAEHAGPDPLNQLPLIAGIIMGLGSSLHCLGMCGPIACAITLAGPKDMSSQQRMAVLMSVVARDRTRASGLAIAMWFFFVLVFDLLMLGLLVVTGGQYSGELLPYLLLLNPADVFRVLNVFSLDDVRTLYGLASIVPPTLGNPWLMGGVMLAWIVAPLGIATWRFRL